MWLKRLALVKKRRQEGARKAAVTRKLKSSAEKSSGQVIRDTNESWCICGGLNCGSMIACDCDECPYEWFHFECVGITDAPSGEWNNSNGKLIFFMFYAFLTLIMHTANQLLIAEVT